MCLDLNSVQGGIYALRNAHMHSDSLRSFPNVAFEMVPVFILLMVAVLRQGRSSSTSSFHGRWDAGGIQVGCRWDTGGIEANKMSCFVLEAFL